jgi:membrane fusion protein (multidrug efflux system)
VRVTLTGATRPDAVLVPQRAVLEGSQGKFVYVVDDKSSAQPRPVELGEWAGSDWIITGGLKAGDRVIIDGVMRIGPGAPVQAASVNGAPPAPQAATTTKK